MEEYGWEAISKTKREFSSLDKIYKDLTPKRDKAVQEAKTGEQIRTSRVSRAVNGHHVDLN